MARGPSVVIDLSKEDDDEPRGGQQTRRDRPSEANGARKANIHSTPPADKGVPKRLANGSHEGVNRVSGKTSERDSLRGNSTFGGARTSLNGSQGRSFEKLRKMSELKTNSSTLNNSSAPKAGDRGAGASRLRASFRAKETVDTDKSSGDELAEVSAFVPKCVAQKDDRPSVSKPRVGSEMKKSSHVVLKRQRESEPIEATTKRPRLDIRNGDAASSSGSSVASGRCPSAPVRRSDVLRTPMRRPATSHQSIDLTQSPAKRIAPKKIPPKQSPGDVIYITDDEGDEPRLVQQSQPRSSTALTADLTLSGASAAKPTAQSEVEQRPATLTKARDIPRHPLRSPAGETSPRSECPETPAASKSANPVTPALEESAVEEEPSDNNDDRQKALDHQLQQSSTHTGTAVIAEKARGASAQEGNVEDRDTDGDTQHFKGIDAQPHRGDQQNLPERKEIEPKMQIARTSEEPDRVDSAQSDGGNSLHGPTTHSLNASRDGLPDARHENATIEAETARLAEGGDIDNEIERSPNQQNADDVSLVTATEQRTADEPTPPIEAMGLSKRVESVLGKYLEEVRGDSEYWNKMHLRRARLSLDTAVSVSDTTDQPYSFASLKPLNLKADDKSATNGKLARFRVEKMPAAGGKGTKTSFSCPVIELTIQKEMPSYAHYVSIKQNFLAPNVTTMQAWPYFNDDFNYSGKEGGLGEYYEIDIEGRPKKLRRLLQAQNLEEYVESALEDLCITWADVLRFLLETDPDVGQEADAQQALSRRHESCAEEFTRDGTRTATVISSLAESEPEILAKAATLCENFLRMAKFSLWHVARRHMFDAIPKKDEESMSAIVQELTCRTCLRLDCPYHGELKRHKHPEDEESEQEDSAIVADIIHPPTVNYRTRMAFRPKAELLVDGEETAPVTKRTLQYWQGNNFIHKIDERGPFQPCHHPGTSCEDASCSCFEGALPCEKACSCPSSCVRKFQGCTCRHDKLRKQQSLVCFEDDRCICFGLSRECDPDLCGTCGVDEVLDPVNRRNDEVVRSKCHNASLQRAVPKHTLIGDSGIHGLGLYAGEQIKAHEFLGEYKGEIITKEEADRRGAVYEHQKLSYLFSLNKDQEIDSTYFGNKIRFINHAGHGKYNLYPRIFLVNTVHRIALFAEKNINKRTELLFDYGPKFPDEQLGGKKARKSVPHTRRANAVEQEFYEVEIVHDAQGNPRATKAAGQRQKERPKKAETTLGKRGGARRGAGRKPFRKSAHDLGEGNVDDEEVKEDFEIERSAGARLAAYNISDEGGPGDAMELDAAHGAEDESDDFEPERSGEEGEDDDEGSEGGRGIGHLRRHKGGPAVRGRRGRGGLR